MPRFSSLARSSAVALAAAVLAAAAHPANAHAQAIHPTSVIKTSGGALQSGRYICHLQYFPSLYTYKLIDFTDAKTYVWLNGEHSTGTMRYDDTSGAITFTGGKLAGRYHAVYGRRDDGHPIFIFIDKSLEPKPGAYDLCTLRSSN